jgi:hypothetical protein
LIPKHPSYRPFIFMVPLDQPEHGVDVRDVARAIGSTVAKEPDGGLFLIGGDDSWRTSARGLRREVFGALGMPTPAERAFRRPTAGASAEGWFYECWMDTEESEEILGFQQIDRVAFLGELRERHRRQKWALLPLRPALGGALLLSSPYVGPRRIVAGPTVWDDICRVFRVPNDVAEAHRGIPTPEAAPTPVS